MPKMCANQDLCGLAVYSTLYIYGSHNIEKRKGTGDSVGLVLWVTQKLPQIYTANHATFPIRIRKMTVQICGNFWVTRNSRQRVADYGKLLLGV